MAGISGSSSSGGGFGATVMAGRLGKKGGLTGVYFDRYFVLDERTLQYESSADSKTMKSFPLEELQDVLRIPSKRARGRETRPSARTHALPCPAQRTTSSCLSSRGPRQGPSGSCR